MSVGRAHLGCDRERITRGAIQSRVRRVAACRTRRPAGPAALWVDGLSHTYTTELANSNVGVYTLMKLLGHQSMATSQRYVAEPRAKPAPWSFAEKLDYVNQQAIAHYCNTFRGVRSGFSWQFSEYSWQATAATRCPDIGGIAFVWCLGRGSDDICGGHRSCIRSAMSTTEMTVMLVCLLRASLRLPAQRVHASGYAALRPDVD